MRFLSTFMVVAIAAMLASVAQAQPGGGRLGGGFGASRLGLLRMEEVQKEVGLTEDQITTVRQLQDDLRPRRGGGQDQPRREFTEEDRQRFMKEAEERSQKEREELAKALKPDQLKRLTEIYVQVAGVGALNDQEVAKSLEITAEQKEQLAKVRDESFAAMREAFGSGEDRESARGKFRELRKANEEKTMAVLTDDQKKKLEDLKGKKFDMPEGAGRRGRRERSENN